jgi:proline dehydrogenase
MSLLRQPLLLLARSGRIKNLVTRMPVSAGIVRSYVPGEAAADAVDATARLVADDLRVSLDYLGEDTLDADQAEATVRAYLDVLAALSARGLTRHAEVSVKLSAIGQALPQQGHKIALENARTICRAARNAGTTVTLDMEDHTTTDATLATLRELRKDFPETGAVVQAYLHRTDVDKSYVRCLKVLMAGQGYPMIATHDPRMIAIASSLASRYGRGAGGYEFQMLYGIRPEEQRRLADAGESVRVYVPYGTEWYGYLMRRLAERPQNLTFFVRSLVSKK